MSGSLLPPQGGVPTVGRGGGSKRGRDKGLTPSASLCSALARGSETRHGYGFAEGMVSDPSSP